MITKQRTHLSRSLLTSGTTVGPPSPTDPCSSIDAAMLGPFRLGLHAPVAASLGPRRTLPVSQDVHARSAPQ